MATPAMMPMLPGVPTAGGAPQPGAGPAPTPETREPLVTPPEAQQTDQKERDRDFMRLVQGMHEQVDTLARQYPQQAENARRLKNLLTRMLMDQVRSPEGMGAEPKAPRIMG